MKKIMSLLCAGMLCICAAPLTVFADGEDATKELPTSGKCGDNCTWSYDAEAKTLTISGTGDTDDWKLDDSGEYTMPWEGLEITDAIIENGVTSIGSCAFCTALSNGELKTVSLPDTLTKIGDCAFESCKFESISIPGSVKSIGVRAFAHNWDCTEVTIADGVERIGSYAFAWNSKLESISIPESVSFIGALAFTQTKWLSAQREENPMVIINGILADGQNCEGDVVIPEGVTSIAESAFAGWGDRIKSVTIPEGVQSIGAGAFYYCTEIESIDIPASVVTLEAAFGHCLKLASIHVSSDNPNYCDIDGVLFTKDRKALIQYPVGKRMTEYSVPDGTESIEREAFDGCGLTEVMLPDSVTSIGAYAFNESGVKNVVIPESVTSIGEYAFTTCGIENIVIPGGVKTIKRYTFWGCTDLKNVTVSEGVTTIEPQAFRCCDGLNEIVLPESVSVIQNSAFYGCENLQKVTILNPACDIQGAPFWNHNGKAFLEKDTEATICGYDGSTAEEYVKSSVGCRVEGNNIIEDGYGYNFESLGAAPEKIPTSGKCGESCTWSYDAETKTLTISGTGAMDDCEFMMRPWLRFRGMIQSVVVGEGITRIGATAFAECLGDPTITVTLPDSLVSIGNDAFCNNGLTSFTIPESVTEIGENAFGQGDITEIRLPSGLKTVSRGMFVRSMLQKIDIPQGVTEIGEEAFGYCQKLTSVTIPASVKTIGKGAFEECESLTEITIPDTVTAIGEDAFAGINDLTIKGYAGSAAETYAKENNITFVSLGTAPVTIPDLPVTLRGDVYCDNIVDVSDAVILARFLVGDKIDVTDQGLANADADANGKLETDDVLCIVKMIAGVV